MMINDISYICGRKYSDGIPAQPATLRSMRNPPISSVYGVNSLVVSWLRETRLRLFHYLKSTVVSVDFASFQIT